jgi:small subunit ribosomal protein S16
VRVRVGRHPGASPLASDRKHAAMAVKLRLRREGAKKAPHYRIVAADSRAPRDGRFIEILGEYHPMDQPSTIKVNGERALYWLRNGAQPTEQVEKLLRIEGVWEEFKPGDKPKRDRSAAPEKQRLSKKARAKAAEAAEAAASGDSGEAEGGGDA